MTQEVPVLLVLPCRKGTFFVLNMRSYPEGVAYPEGRAAVHDRKKRKPSCRVCPAYPGGNK
jgi:hypothetical protein